MQYHTILFDLDGTLTDPKEGITKSVAYALQHFGIQVENLDSLTCYIGPPLAVSFPEYHGISEEDTPTAVAKYRERFSDVGWAENLVYDGIEQMLAALKQAGKKLLVATSKPEVFAVRILEHFGLDGYFDLICGAPMHAPKGHGKADVIRDALERAGISELSDAIMVGDRLHDVEGAHKIGLPCIGVLYGYGDREEMEACRADYIAEDVEALRAMLL
ncbi:MAG: HAD family hydrolase [Oscillospiraceae bacterium]|nr:HAD family hydrolase [Oscillospiraceae bacterium]MBR2484431.1 HAD family hydrolase [Oscillospiraceae bacterium]